MILHAGDIVDLSVLDDLRKIAPVNAVAGNMDRADTTAVLPAKTVIEAGGYRIGLIHGHGAPAGIIDRIRPEFDDVDCIVFGHTHQSLIKTISGVLFVNPGSPTDQRFAMANTLGILELDEAITAKIIELKPDP